MSFIIGHTSNPQAKLKVNDPTVSKAHVKVERNEEAASNALRLTNLSTTTYPLLDGKPFKSIVMMPGQVVRVGDCDFRYSQLVRHLPRDGHRFFEEFKRMQPVFQEYAKKKEAINDAHNRKVLLFRGLIIGGSLIIIFLIANALGIDSSKFRIGIGAVSILGAVFARKLVPNAKKVEQLKALGEEYKLKLSCPKGCGIALLNKSYEELQKSGHCPNGNCNAQYAPI